MPKVLKTAAAAKSSGMLHKINFFTFTYDCDLYINDMCYSCIPTPVAGEEVQEIEVFRRQRKTSMFIYPVIIDAYC